MDVAARKTVPIEARKVMRKPPFAPSLPGVLILLGFTPGCQVLYQYRPVPVLVRDAETKNPLPDAQLRLSYPLSRDSLAPFDSSEKTGPDGIAHLRAAPYGGFGGVRIEARAAGYLPEKWSLSKEDVQRIPPAQPFEKIERRPAELVIDLYKEPRFTVELLVPVGYRGLIKVVRALRDDLPAPPGQRCFRYEVNDGFVRIQGPGVLRRVHPSEYRARYADGTELSGETTLTKIGFRWLSGEGDRHLFFIGTQSEYDVQRRSLAVEKP
jgi:hypothetical protein